MVIKCKVNITCLWLLTWALCCIINSQCTITIILYFNNILELVNIISNSFELISCYNTTIVLYFLSCIRNFFLNDVSMFANVCKWVLKELKVIWWEDNLLTIFTTIMTYCLILNSVLLNYIRVLNILTKFILCQWEFKLVIIKSSSSKLLKSWRIPLTISIIAISNCYCLSKSRCRFNISNLFCKWLIALHLASYKSFHLANSDFSRCFKSAKYSLNCKFTCSRIVNKYRYYCNTLIICNSSLC